MTEKRFTLEEFGLNFIVNDTGRNLTAKQTVDVLNEQHETISQLKLDNTNLHRLLSKKEVEIKKLKGDDLND